MAHFLEHIKSSAPAIPALIMAAGTGYMVSPDAPEHVRYGGGCLLAIAVMLADMQSGKKIGYSDKIVKAVRKIPGLEKADEGTVLGTLTIAACTFLGGGAAMNMAENGPTWPEAVKLGVNTISYPLSGAVDFQRSRLWLENSFGKEIKFEYTDAEGKTQTTKPISTSRLIQQLSLISGALGITYYGAKIDVSEVEATGALFMLSNLTSIWGMTKEQINEVWQAKKSKPESKTPVKVDIKDIAKTIEPVVSELNINPKKGKGR